MTENGTRQVVRLIRKSNELVEGRYKFDMWETRVFTKMISMIRRDDEDFKDYRIYITDIMQEYGFENSKSVYQRMKVGAEKLMRKIIKTVREDDTGQLVELTTPIVASIQNPISVKEDGAYVEVSFHPKMRPLLLQLQSKFTTYDIRNILRLPSTYSTRIYELLKQYEKIGKRSFDLRTLKEMVGAIELINQGGREAFEDTYPLYGNFKQKVLLKAQRDLKKYTDIRFEFETTKKGRKVNGLIFYIYPNKAAQSAADQSQSLQVDRKPQALFTELYPLMKDWEDITEKGLQTAIGKYSEQQIRGAYHQTIEDHKSRKEQGTPIQSRGKWFYKLAQVPTLFDEIQQKKIVAQKREEHRKKLEADHQAKLDRHKKQKKDSFTKEVIIVQQILAEEPDVREEAIREIMTRRSLSREAVENANLLDTWIHMQVKNLRPDRFKN